MKSRGITFRPASKASAFTFTDEPTVNTGELGGTTFESVATWVVEGADSCSPPEVGTTTSGTVPAELDSTLFDSSGGLLVVVLDVVVVGFQ